MVSMISGCEFRPAPDPFVTNRIPTFTEQQIIIDIATPLPDSGQHLIEAASLHQTLVGPIHS